LPDNFISGDIAALVRAAMSFGRGFYENFSLCKTRVADKNGKPAMLVAAQ
jgi:hypothetical protein